MVATFLAVYLLTILGLDEQHIGFNVGAYGCGIITGSLLGGWLSTRTSAITLMAASSASMGLGFLWLSTVVDPDAFLAGIFACGNFEAMFRPPATLLLMRACTPVDRPRSHSVYYTAQSAGYALGAAVGGALSQVNFSFLFLANGLLGILTAIAVLCLLPPHAGGLAHTGVGAQPPKQETGHVPWGAPFVAVCLVALIHYSISNQRLVTYPLYLTTHYGFDAAGLGAIFSLNGFLIAMAGISVNAWVKQVDQWKVAAIGSFALATSFALLPVGNHVTVAFLLCVVMSLGDILFSPTITSMAYFLAPRDAEGGRLGVFFAIAYSARFLGPVLGTWSFVTVGPSTTWLLCGVLGLVCGLMLSAFLRTKHKC